ncbi:MAG TPA: stage II sporulation protein E [Leptospiraceae bacterium]|nr:stage II sporulation protein E [Leptospiraceae bacterium]
MRKIKISLLLATMTVSSLSAETVYLDGEWFIRNGFEPEFAATANAPEKLGPEGKPIPYYFTESPERPIQAVWRRTEYPVDFGSLNNSGRQGWVTLRYSVPVDRIFSDSDGEVTAHEAGYRNLALFSGMISDVSRFYVNGHLIGGLGRTDPYVSGSYLHFLESFPESMLEGEDTLYLTVALYRHNDFKLYMSDSRMQIGPANQVLGYYYAEEIIGFALLSIYGAVGLYHLLLYSRRRMELHNLYFGLFCLGVTMYWFFRTGTRDLLFGSHILLRTTVEYSLLFTLGPLLILFLSQFFYRRHSKIGLGYAAFCGLLILGTVFSPYHIKANLLTLWQLSALPFLVYFVFYIAREVFRKNVDAYWLLAGFIFLCSAATHDILAARGIVNTPHMGRYAFVIFILGIAGVLANRFVRVHNQVEELNQNLEKKVEKRTEELQKSLQEIQTLKVQQDGDYYLTSLLSKPLGGNFVESKQVDIDILVRQKKQFHFRRWEAEIGGDIIASHCIELQGKRYAAFVNGDAMGKSIQGAGGALVLGVVFKAIISRTQQSAEMQRMSPEKWLRICFEELQNVFVSFDGTMMISAVLGLVDESTGLLYFINAEHPWTVLYRNEKASFLEDGLQLRKIGIDALAGGLEVQLFSMQQDDIIFIGSDGRDDIQLGIDEAGYRIINEDESQFLRRVEEGRGQLDLIEEKILATGKLTDDFTLIRIAYREDAPLEEDPDPGLINSWTALKQTLSETASQDSIRELAQLLSHISGLRPFASQKDVLREMGQFASRWKDHTLAARVYEQLLDRFPEDTDSLFRLSYQLKLAGEFRRAADVGEQVRLRNRGHIKNLVNLSDCHRLASNPDRAIKILKEVLAIEPENENARLLQEKLGLEVTAG